MARPMRADARRNLERILAAARDMIVERGPDVPLDDVARRAEVGSGTLYRRFPDRGTLLHAVALDALTGTLEAARDACEREPDPFEALARYLRRTLDLRVSAVLPALLGRVDLENDPELAPLRAESLRLLEGLVAAAHADGSLPDGVTFADIGMMAVRIARPLPGPLPPEEDQALARRHLDLFVRGLRAQAAS
ncbi:TetR/AcrR family transcriptional regulator [Actinomadura nitritigenes]|uniref:TetR/AcrR family transcriptional regulator n=1 Tax=Actinomadura nitritigenes TaxID=134602 RepID=UPI00367C1482